MLRVALLQDHVNGNVMVMEGINYKKNIVKYTGRYCVTADRSCRGGQTNGTAFR